MSPELTITVAEGIAAAAILLWALYGPWQQLVTDYTRQRLFEIRDQMFDRAVEGRIAFDSPAYQRMRSSLNSLIRFCHELTWPRLLAYRMAVRPKTAPSDSESWVSGVDDPHLRQEIKRKEAETMLVIFTSVVVRSPLLLMALPVATPLFLLLVALNPSQRWRLERRAVVLTHQITREARAV